MSTATASTTAGQVPDTGGKGLRGGAIGLLSSIVIGVSSVAPGYSIAATLGYVVALVGFKAPAIMLLAFVPMLFIAYAYQELNRVAPDCGTTFTWSTKAFGPYVGWMGGWGIIAADVIVMASLAQVAGIYGFLLVGADGLADDTLWTTVVGVLWIAALTYVCYRGIEVSARFQFVMLAIEVVVLAAFAVVALVKVATGHAAAGSVDPSPAWFWPDHLGSVSNFSAAILLAVFIYWGWDTCVAVNEETRDKERTPGRAAILSTVILLAIYAVVSVACIAFVGPKALTADGAIDDVLAVLGNLVLGSGVGKLLIFCVLTSAAASTQTTILPTARTTLSMAAYQALPASFARMHRRFLTPTYSTLAMGVASIAFYVALVSISDNVLADATASTGLLIAFYYGMTGFASAWFFRRDRGSTLREVAARIVLPLLGGLMLTAAFVKTVYDDWDPETSYSTLTVFGHRTGAVFFFAVGSLLLGVVLMLATKWRSPEFFRGTVLTADTPVLVVEGDPVPATVALPDSAGQEQTVIPPMSVQELRHASRRGRRGGSDG